MKGTGENSILLINNQISFIYLDPIQVIAKTERNEELAGGNSISGSEESRKKRIGSEVEKGTYLRGRALFFRTSCSAIDLLRPYESTC